MRLSPLASTAGLPFGLALDVAWPWVAGPVSNHRAKYWGREKNVKTDKTAMCERLILLGEIVYPCISDPIGEDEGGQASSSLAVSTQWISAAKLLQSDLVTLTQREGGE
ncbi:hypothetical protein B296_00053260 [Ensete ventricosum]|uniref:Uncharacterized protein n=1 Tax=Ensete ventricosum TaxID=4639 RepID=A0A426X3A0_ENSVE|nr:hypothetical protein B296_00053260 [Ensete ventricosum]